MTGDIPRHYLSTDSHPSKW